MSVAFFKIQNWWDARLEYWKKNKHKYASFEKKQTEKLR